MAVEQADAYLRTGRTGAPEKQLIDCILIVPGNARRLSNFDMRA
jgi:erythritol transport system substrate-binding protein